MSRLRPTATLATAAMAAVLALPTNVPPAAADAAVREYAEMLVTVVGRDRVRYGVYVAGFGVDEVDGRPKTAVVEVRRCPDRTTGCTVVLDARIAIPASAFTVGDDLANAKLTTSFRGIPLTVTWTATGPAPVAPGLQVWAAPTVRTGPQRTARATIAFLGIRCPAVAATVAHEVTVSTQDLYAPTTGEIPAALRGAPAPRCV